MATPADLKKVSFFAELSEKELNEIFSFCRFRKCKDKEVIFFETEPYAGFFAVLSGRVKIFKISPEGREHIIHFISPPNTFAEALLFEKFGRTTETLTYPANAMALEDDTEVVFVPAEKFVSITKDNITICYKLISSLSKRLRNLNRHIETLVLDDVYKRICKYILIQIEKKPVTGKTSNSAEISLKINKNDLASHLGTISETLSRCFKKLQEEKLIEINGRKIFIPDIKALKKKII